MQDPLICPYCGNPAVWCENKEIYGQNYGRSVMCWYCKPCNAYVGCHNNSKRPLGSMANAETREWRKRTHAAIDPLWKWKKMRRGEMYGMLNQHFGRQIHIGESDVETCKAIIQFVKEKYPNGI